jgi:4-hydroxybenzoate polyprenyltransferase
MSDPRWLGAWAAERFPLRNALFFAVFFATGAAAALGAGVLASWPRLTAGFVALWGFFLLLRVLDEHKDYAADAVAHPQRVLQRGLVTLGDLRLLAATAMLVQLGVTVMADNGHHRAILWWIAALGWAALMAAEFFARRWLRQRLIWYALSHMLVMPLVAGWVLALAGGASVRVLAAYAALAFFGGLGFEIARKIRAPEDERPMADSYTGALGVRRAALVLALVVAAAEAAALVLPLVVVGSLSIAGSAIIAIATVVAVRESIAFGNEPTRARARRTELAVGSALLVGHLVALTTLVLG